jgi:ATP-dependent Lon protease
MTTPSNAAIRRDAALQAQERLAEFTRGKLVKTEPRFQGVRLAQSRHLLFRMSDLEQASIELETRAGDARITLKSTIDALRALGPWRPLAATVSPSEISALQESFANFTEVIAFVEAQLALAGMTPSRAAYVPPILLLGDPGVGKTAFAAKLAQLMGTGFMEISMAGTTGGFVIAGLDSGWAGGKPGQVLKALAWATPSNPVILLDEVDKATSGSRFDPTNTLLGLLEAHSAARFTDEYLSFPIDASKVIWVATANEADVIPRPLLSRFRVFHIQLPDREQGRRIAHSVYKNLRASADWGCVFPELLPDGVATLLATLSPRAQRQRLLDAFGNAARDGRRFIHQGDIRELEPSSRASRIGF